MPTIMLGTSDALLNLNFARAAAAADAKLAASTPVAHPPAPNYTATLGLAYQPDHTLNRNWDTIDLAVSTGAVPPLRTLRFTHNAAANINFGRILVTLAAAGIVIPTEMES
jgi:hypothetical protein